MASVSVALPWAALRVGGPRCLLRFGAGWELEMTPALLPLHIQQLRRLLMVGSEDDGQFLPGSVLHHPHHALQTGETREGDPTPRSAALTRFSSPGTWNGVGLGLPPIWSHAEDGRQSCGITFIGTQVAFNLVGPLRAMGRGWLGF